jgi:hypothetical protein
VRKTILILIVSFIALNAPLTGQTRGAAGMQPPEFDAQKAAGIVTYDYEKVIKKLKVKKDTSVKAVARAIYDYNIRIDELSMVHTATLENLEKEFDQNVRIAMQNRDRSHMNGVKTKIQEIIPPIRMLTNAEQSKLDLAMAAVLDEKQFNKWMKYQKSQRSNQI